MAMLNHQMVILVAQLLLQLNLLTWCVLLQFALAYCWCWGGVGCSNVHLNLLAHLMLRWRWGCVGVVWKQTSASTSVSTGNLWCLEAEISECPGIFQRLVHALYCTRVISSWIWRCIWWPTTPSTRPCIPAPCVTIVWWRRLLLGWRSSFIQH